MYGPYPGKVILSPRFCQTFRRFPSKVVIWNVLRCSYCFFFVDAYLRNCQNQVGFDKRILSYINVCPLPSEVSLQLKNLPKKLSKTSIVKVKLIQFSIAHACLLRML